jgi:hypothetical protein
VTRCDNCRDPLVPGTYHACPRTSAEDAYRIAEEIVPADIEQNPRPIEFCTYRGRRTDTFDRHVVDIRTLRRHNARRNTVIAVARVFQCDNVTVAVE